MYSILEGWNWINSRGCALDRLHSSRRPCGAVAQRNGVTSQRHGAARLSRRDFFALFDPVTFDFWPFDLILIGVRGIVMDHHVPSLTILVSVVLILSCGHTDRQTYRQTESQRRINDLLTRLPSAWEIMKRLKWKEKLMNVRNPQHSINTAWEVSDAIIIIVIFSFSSVCLFCFFCVVKYIWFDLIWIIIIIKPGFHNPSWRPELTGDRGFHYPPTRAVNSGSGNRA